MIPQHDLNTNSG